MHTASGSYTWAKLERSRAYHVSCDETCDVQVWSAIEIELVMDELIRSIWRNSFLWKGIFWNGFGTTIPTGVWCRNISMDVIDFGVTNVATERNNIIRIDVLAIRLDNWMKGITLWRTMIQILWLGDLGKQREAGDSADGRIFLWLRPHSSPPPLMC